MLRKIFGFMTEELAGEWSKYVARGFILRAPHQTTLFFFFIRHCNPCGFWPAQLSFSILSSKVFTECRCQRHVKPPNLEDQWLEGSNSRHQVSPSSETTRANPSSGRWNYGREISENFADSGDFHVTFGFFLHAVNLRHGTDGFTSPPKEGAWGFFRPKPANLGTKGQHVHL